MVRSFLLPPRSPPPAFNRRMLSLDSSFDTHYAVFQSNSKSIYLRINTAKMVGAATFFRFNLRRHLPTLKVYHCTILRSATGGKLHAINSTMKFSGEKSKYRVKKRNYDKNLLGLTQMNGWNLYMTTRLDNCC